MTTTNAQPTERQREVLEFICERSQMSGPTIREIMQHFGFTSPNGAMCHIRALERKGLIRRRAHVVRGIEVVT